MAYLRSVPDLAGCRRDRRAGRAFTLIELTVSVVVLGILAVGMSSAVLLATHALPGAKTPQTLKVEGANLLQKIAADLAFATTIPVHNPGAIVFTVHDRNQGATGAETLSFTWSGVAGTALVHQFNSTAATALTTNVSAFSIAYDKEIIPLSTAPKVLMVVANSASLTTDETERKTLVESWGMAVTTISRDATGAQLQTAAVAVDVLHITPGNYRATLASAINGLTRGVVSEDSSSYVALGIAPSSQNNGQKTVDIVNNTHEITSVWPNGNIDVITSNDQLFYANTPLASGATVLGSLSVLLVLNGPALVVLDYGNTMSQGTPAPSRRVKLPWAETVSVSELTDEAKILMQRSITWAAAPRVFSSVQVTLQIGANSQSRVQTAVKMLNLPREDGT